MTQQMQFTRSLGDKQTTTTAWTSSSSSSPPRIVTFARQKKPPSPVVYQSRAQKEYSANQSEELPRRQQPHTQITTQRDGSSAKSIALRSKPRKPAWDADVSHNLTLFDASLKKSILFQPRATGDHVDDTSQSLAQSQVTKRKKKAHSRSKLVRYRSGPSSVYSQQRQSVHWPQRKPKDFVQQNIVHLTGQQMYTPSKQSKTRSRNQEEASKRQSTFQVGRPLRKSHTLEKAARTEQDSNDAPSLEVSSQLYSPPATEHLSALPIDGSPPNKVMSSSVYLSPQRSQQSHSSSRSPSSRRISTNRVYRTHVQSHRDNYLAQVFRVLDRDHKKRIGVNQVLQGLRLLSLPATHSQISDYIYLIHEGLYDSIDLEEWEILVSTLDAASRPAESPRKAHAGSKNATTSRSPFSHQVSLPPSSPRSTSPHSRYRPSSASSLNQNDLVSAGANQTTHDIESCHVTSIQREPAKHQPLSDDDPYLKEIQNRIEEMFDKAQALRLAPEATNIQFADDLDRSRSDRVLKRATRVVYNLRASLFPLVHQAESILRELQQRHCANLSLFLPPNDMAAIARNSDVLATAILDDILLDTVQLLNDEEKQKSRYQLQVHHAGQLDNVMNRILEIEREEDNMIHQGLDMKYQSVNIKRDHSPVLPPEDHAKVYQHECAETPKLTLPLEVVMNISASDDDSDQLSPGVVGTQIFEKSECASTRDNSLAQQVVLPGIIANTSILEGKRLQLIERRRRKFEHHRRLVESSLAESGMTQCAVIEILEGMLVDDLVEQIAVELSDTVLSMSDTLLTNLL
ncbi:putative EF-hand domain-containing protein [Plasmopara halstedii]